MQPEIYCPLLLFFAACVRAQTIEIHGLEKKNINSSCEIGMITQMDRYVYNVDVDLTYATNRWLKIVEFEIKNSDSSQFLPLCLLNLENGCRDTYCYCKQKPTTNQTTHHIIINITAYEENSEAEIRGVLSTVNAKQMYSNTVKLPVIYDLSKRFLKANNIPIYPNQSPYKLKQTGRRIEFCCLNTPSPCLTTVVANHSATTSGDRCTVIDVPLDAGYDNVTVVTSVCYSHNFTSVIMLETEDIASTPNQTNNTNLCTETETLESDATFATFHYKLIFLVIPAALIILIPVILITVFRVFRKQCKSEIFLRNNDEEQYKNKFITEKEKKEKCCVEAADCNKSLMKAIHLKRPSEDNSDQVNSYTTILDGAARTATTMPEDMCAV